MKSDAEDRLQSGNTKSSTILFVDDEVVIAMVATTLIADLGYTVMKASSGARALEILRGNQPIDLLITDFSMPKMNGLELARAARLLFPDLPVLIATGYSDVPDEGDETFPLISKPFLQSQLALQISKALGTS